MGFETIANRQHNRTCLYQMRRHVSIKCDFCDHFVTIFMTFVSVLNRAPAGNLPPAEHPSQVQDGSRGQGHRRRLGLQRLLLHPMDILQQGQSAANKTLIYCIWDCVVSTVFIIDLSHA